MAKLLSLFILTYCICSSSQAADRPSKNPEPPNVVLVYIDDLGYGDIGCYGSQDIPTPNIDRLATEGVRFTASYITNPPCCPSRCALMMGQYAQRFGKYGMSRGLPIPEDRPTLAAWMNEQGYVTGQIGKWDIGTKRQGPLQVGFSTVARTPPKKTYTPKEQSRLPSQLQKLVRRNGGKSKYFCVNEQSETEWLTDYDGRMMVDFIKNHRDERFFLYWSPSAVHSPSTETPERLMKRTTATGKRRKLAGAIVSVDDQIGRLLDVLDSENLRQKTLVIFSSDNGANGAEGGSSAPYTGGKGAGTQKEGWVRVPTVLSMPGTLPEGTEHDGLIANFDLYSTIAARTPNGIPDHCDGVDLFQHVDGSNTKPAHEYLFWLNNEPGDAIRRHLVAVRWQNYRLYRKTEQDPWQLFDLKKDPTEADDISKANPEIVKQLNQQHQAWKKTLAPLNQIPNIKGKGAGPESGHGWATAKAAP